MWFRPKCPVDAEEWEWLLAGFKWLEREFPQLSAGRIIALPTRDYFPPLSSGELTAQGEELLGHVQRLAGLADWPVRLIAVAPPRRGAVNGITALQSEAGACGSFR